MHFVPSSFLFLIANVVTTRKALVTRSDALVPSSFLFLIASLLLALARSDALVPSSFLFLIASLLLLVRHLLLEAMHLFLVASCF